MVWFQKRCQEQTAREQQKDVPSQKSRTSEEALSKREACEDANIISCTGARAPRTLRRRGQATTAAGAKKKKKKKKRRRRRRRHIALADFLHWCWGSCIGGGGGVPKSQPRESSPRTLKIRTQPEIPHECGSAIEERSLRRCHHHFLQCCSGPKEIPKERPSETSS